MKKNIFIVSILIFIIVLFVYLISVQYKRKAYDEVNSDPFKKGYVPDEKTAIKIAEAIWLPIYGEKIYEERPFHVFLKEDSIWVIDGTLKNGVDGGVVHAEIQKKDCKILNVTHYK